MKNISRRIYRFIKEYAFYIYHQPTLIYMIPIKVMVGIILHVKYIYVRLTGTERNKSLIKELKNMRQDMKSVSSFYKPSELWEDLYQQFNKVLHTENINHFKTQRFNRRFSAFPPGDVIFYQMFLWLYWQEIMKIDKLHILKDLDEPEVGMPDIYLIQSRRISLDLLQSVNEFYSIYDFLPEKKDHLVIAELGAGYGRLGYIFLNVMKKTTYIIIDLPGSLIISQYYLSQMFPDAPILTYEDIKHLKNIDRKCLSKYRIVCMTPWQLAKIADDSLDLFINIYSFQEMTKRQIKNYFSLINKKCMGLFYSKQFYEYINPKDDVVILQKDYPVYSHWKELYNRTSTIHMPVFESLYRIEKNNQK